MPTVGVCLKLPLLNLTSAVSETEAQGCACRLSLGFFLTHGVHLRLILAALVALCTISQAQAGITAKVGVNYDGTVTTLYRAGEKPIAGGASPSGYTCDGVGNGGGEIDETSATVWTFSVVGSSTIQNHFRCYKDGGGSDLQLTAEVQNDYNAEGTIGNYGSLGLGVREAAASGSWAFQVLAPFNGNASVQCNAGTTAASTTNYNGLAGQSRPRFIGLTYDVSEGDLRCWEKTDGGSWSRINQTFRTLSDDVVYGFGASGSSTVTMSGTWTDFSIGSTITIYTPETAPGGSDPQWDTPIGSLNFAQSSAFSLDVSGYCSISSGTKSFSGSGWPTGISISSAGVISGTATTVSTGSATVQCSDGTNQTPDVSSWSVTAAAPGDTFVISLGTSSFNAGISQLKQGGGSAVPGPGDTIVIAAGTRSSLQISNVRGSATNPITIKNDTTAGQRVTISGTGSFPFRLTNVRYAIVDGTGKWSGAGADGCGTADSWPNAPATPQCGIRVVASASGPTTLLKFQQGTRDITVKGVEVDGNNFATIGMACHDNGFTASGNPGVWLENQIITDNYFHDTRTETLYCGHNWSTSAAGSDFVRSRNNTISYNYVKDAGYEGIDLKSCLEGCEVHHNFVDGAGVSLDPPSTGNGGVCVGGYEAVASFYNNYVEDCYGNGVSIFLDRIPSSYTLEAAIYNNVVVRAGTPSNNKACISINSTSTAANISSADIAYNTCNASDGVGIQVGSNVGNPGITVRQNVIASPGGSALSTGGGTSLTGNVTGTTASFNFTNTTTRDYRPASGSSLCGAASGSAPATDQRDNARSAPHTKGALNCAP